MKRYQAMILGSVISLGSFALGMNSFTCIHTNEHTANGRNHFSPVNDSVTVVSRKEREILQSVMNQYVKYVDNVVRFQREEYELTDRNSGIVDVIIEANKAILDSNRQGIFLKCQMYKYSDRTELNEEELPQSGPESDMRLIKTVYDICENYKVNLEKE